MKETGLPLIAPMVLATLADRKTNTRRVIVPQPTEQVYQVFKSADFAPRDRLDNDAPDFGRIVRCPYGTVGDRLWVREAVSIGWHDGGPLAVDYHADGARRTFEPDTDQKAQAAAAYIGDSRRPPFLMPKWASRIWLEVTSVRVERVQEITPRGVVAEGLYHEPGEWGPDEAYDHLIKGFAHLWDDINAKRGYSWESNPWVWAIGFRRLRESEVTGG